VLTGSYAGLIGFVAPLKRSSSYATDIAVCTEPYASDECDVEEAFNPCCGVCTHAYAVYLSVDAHT